MDFSDVVFELRWVFYEKIVLELEVFDFKDKFIFVDWELGVIKVDLINVSEEIVLKNEKIESFEKDKFDVENIFDEMLRKKEELFYRELERISIEL